MRRVLYKLHRLYPFSSSDATIGFMSKDNEALCWTLENEEREVKIPKISAIPRGVYKLKLRIYGSHHERYARKFSWHRGMIQLEHVPNFRHILIHIGNTAKDTDGCILVGSSATPNSILQSTVAYEKLYKLMLSDLTDDMVDCYISVGGQRE